MFHYNICQSKYVMFREMQGVYRLLSTEVEQLPYWKSDIRFFKVEGPNHEVIELCEMLA